ncbi:MAG: BadF/BadG/BcrA/BcrD ATPase family protein [Candidatus Izemoplasmatales bacterium]
MKYIIAYDGGGTKTRINVIDLQGNILFDKITRGSNIVSSGELEFKSVIEGLFLEAMKALTLKDEDIALIYLGLSGADLKEDYQRLENVCQSIFNGIKFRVVNDAWIILRSGLKKAYGACCIAGTGTNACAIDRSGRKAILRALSYITGTFGGGLDIARDALHYAFRANELTYKPTQLQEEIPKILNIKNMEEAIPLLYPKRLLDKKTFGDITGAVETCALKGDEVAIMILKNVATHIAFQTAGVIKQLGMENEALPVVVGGRVFQIKAEIFLKTFKDTLKNEVPNFKIIIPKFNPVIGSYLFALDELKMNQSKKIENQLIKSGGKL